jgi:hypothetical protein
VADPLLAFCVKRWLVVHGKAIPRARLSEDEERNLLLCFHMMDADGSGAIDAEELWSAFKASRHAATVILDIPNPNPNTPVIRGRLFRRGGRGGQGCPPPRAPPCAAGGVSLRDAMWGTARRLAQLLGYCVTRREVDALVGAVDKDGSGEIDLPEFIHVMTANLDTLLSGGTGSKAGAAAAGPGAPARVRATALPFDIVATAYKRKKLMNALQQGTK